MSFLGTTTLGGYGGYGGAIAPGYGGAIAPSFSSMNAPQNYGTTVLPQGISYGTQNYNAFGAQSYMMAAPAMQLAAAYVPMAAPESKHGFTVHEAVFWTNDDKDIPKGAIGHVSGFTPTRVRVQYPTDFWDIDPKELNPAFVTQDGQLFKVMELERANTQPWSNVEKTKIGPNGSTAAFLNDMKTTPIRPPVPVFPGSSSMVAYPQTVPNTTGSLQLVEQEPIKKKTAPKAGRKKGCC